MLNMMMTHRLDAPLALDTLQSLRAGDIVALSGVVFTARDAAHKRMLEALAAGLAPPVDVAGGFIFYAGPAPASPGRVIGPIAATTSARMDAFLEPLYKLGLAGTIGKGERTAEAAALCKRYKRVYLLSVGGAAALISRHITDCRTLAYEDLGPESLKRLQVESLRLVVGIDTQGRVLQDEEIPKYKRPRA